MCRIPALLGIEAAVFVTASLVHAGLLIGGYAHQSAMVAEGVLATVLAAAAVMAAVRPAWAVGLALAAQGFALLGTAVGMTMVLTGVGPHTRLDVAAHAVMLSMLTAGLAVASCPGRHRRASASSRRTAGV